MSSIWTDFFEFLGHNGGFFYERWGDAPVHSIAASVFLPKERIYFFDDLGYCHKPYNSCRSEMQFRVDPKCACDPGMEAGVPKECGIKYYDAMGIPNPWPDKKMQEKEKQEKMKEEEK